MARLTRQTLIQFGSSGGSSNFGQFGSQAASAPVTTKNIATLQSLAAWGAGWQNAVALGQAPYLQDMNGWMYVHSYEACYIFQDGIPEWDAGTTYYIGAVVKNLGNSGYVEYYVSLVNTNTGNALPTRTTDANWQFDHAVKTSSGLIIPGTPTNDSAPTGAVGEWVGAVATLQNPGTAAFANLASIALTAGDWDVSGLFSYNSGGGGTDRVTLALSVHSGNTATDQVDGDNMATGPTTSGTSAPTGFVSIPSWRLSLSGSATVYLKGSSPTTPQNGNGRISARRMR